MGLVIFNPCVFVPSPVLLRPCRGQGVPKKQPVFSKRLTYTEAKATYSPAREEHGRALSSGLASSTEDGLQARVRQALLPCPTAYSVPRGWSREKAPWEVTLVLIYPLLPTTHEKTQCTHAHKEYRYMYQA